MRLGDLALDISFDARNRDQPAPTVAIALELAKPKQLVEPRDAAGQNLASMLWLNGQRRDRKIWPIAS